PERKPKPFSRNTTRAWRSRKRTDEGRTDASRRCGHRRALALGHSCARDRAAVTKSAERGTWGVGRRGVGRKAKNEKKKCKRRILPFLYSPSHVPRPRRLCDE